MFSLGFKERMAGFIEFHSLDPSSSHEIQSQTKYPFEINIETASSSLFKYPLILDFMGKASFPGIPLAPTLPEKSAHNETTGTLKIAASGLSYDFTFSFLGEKEIRVVGAKHYMWGLNIFKLIKSLTTLNFKAYDGEKEIGEGILYYLNPVWQFPLSLRLFRSKNKFHRLRGLAENMASFSEILVPNFENICSREDVIRTLERELEDPPWILRLYLHALMIYLRTIARIVFWKKVENFNLKKRERLASMWNKSSYFYTLSYPLFAYLLPAIYDRKDYLISQNQNMPEAPKNTEPEEWMQLNQTPFIYPEDEREIEVDVVVVGSGAGGAVVAYELARKGHAVAIIEEGHYFKRPDFEGMRGPMIKKLYQYQGYGLVFSNSPFWLPTGKAVGGTTLINSGTCIRPQEWVLKRWEDKLGLKNLSLEKYYSEVEEMLKIKSCPAEVQGSIRKVLDKGLEGSGLHAEPLVRAEDGCDGQSFCTMGCPIDAKRSTNVSYIPEALKNNAYLFSRYRAEKILFEGNKATGIKAVVPGYPDDFSLTFKAKKIVIAGGAFNTPFLLRKNKVGANLKNLGRNLTVHPAITIGASFNHVVRDKLFVPQSLGIFGVNHDDYIFEGYTLPVDTVPMAFPLLGSKHKNLMDNIDKFTNFSAMHRDSKKGSLLYTKWGVLPKYFISKKTNKALVRSAFDLAEIFFKAGAKTIYMPIRGLETIDSKEQLDNLKRKWIPSYSISLSAYHPLGTCRMGDSPKNSVVDRNGAIWGYKNLHIADGSIIPGPLGVNPQITIMSNALRIANVIEEEL